MTAELPVRVHPELRKLVEDEANRLGLALNDVVAPILAQHYNRPDLATVPRKRPGRPRKTEAKR